MRRWPVTMLVLSILFSAHASAPAGGKVAGHWAGAVDLPTGKLSIAVDLGVSEDGGWGGKIDIPQQGIRALPLLDVEVEGTAVSFRLPELPGNPTLEGTLSEDGGSISGHLLQSGQSFPFSIERAEASAADADPYADYEKAGSPGEGLAGTWRGLIVAGPSRLRVVLEVADGDEGGLTGSFSSPDQGGAKIALDSITLEQQAVSFAIGRIAASYAGELSEDGSQIIGTWTQGAQGAPLDLRRASSD